jgi:hypothetical protein
LIAAGTIDSTRSLAEPKSAAIRSIGDHESGDIEASRKIIFHDDASPLGRRDLAEREPSLLESLPVPLKLRRQPVRRDQDQGTEFVRLTIVDCSLFLWRPQ